jgi:hypothetical protein
MLHGSGILVLVPAPERFAVHKLILALQRPIGAAKRDKDVAQAGALILALLEKRSEDLRLAWAERVNDIETPVVTRLESDGR